MRLKRKRMSSQGCMTSLTLLLLMKLSASVLYEPKNLTIGVMLSWSGTETSEEGAAAAVSISIQKINESPEFQFVLDKGYKFQYLLDNVPCEPSDAFAEMMDLFMFKRSGNNIPGLVQDAFVGPSCDEVCQPGGRLARYFDVIMISYGCKSYLFDNKKEYPTFGRTTPTFHDMKHFFADVIQHYQWPRVTIVTIATPVWQDTLVQFETYFLSRAVDVGRWVLESVSSIGTPDFHAQLLDQANKTRVYLLLLYPGAVIELMREMDEAGLRDGENVFLAADYAGYHKNADLQDAAFLDGLLDVTYDVQPDNEIYKDFLHQILNSSRSDDCLNYESGIHPLLISDGIYVIANLFNLSLASGVNISQGAAMANLTHNATFPGLVYDIEIDETGTRKAKFMLHNLQSGCYVPIARSGQESGLQFLSNTVTWPGGSKQIPTGQPKCGWSNELCTASDKTVSVITGSFIGAMLLFLSIVGVVLFYSLYKKNARQLATDWLKEWDDIKWRVVDPFTTRELSNLNMDHKSVESLVSVCSGISYTSEFMSRQTGPTSYHCPVVIMGVAGTWALKFIKKANVHMTEGVKRELNLVRSLKHPNINPFLAACVTQDHVSLMWLYSPKGSLMNLIYSGIFKMELMFQLSFAQDIAKGLAFLHNSDIGVHGRLKSSNIVVDSGLTCKLTDIDMPKFREGERDIPSTDPIYWFQQVWTAPERLRSPSKKATQTGDVYSYGIILYEIMFKRRPYITDSHMRTNTEPDWQDVIATVREPHLYQKYEARRRESVYTVQEEPGSRGDEKPTVTRLYSRNIATTLRQEQLSPPALYRHSVTPDGRSGDVMIPIRSSESESLGKSWSCSPNCDYARLTCSVGPCECSHHSRRCLRCVTHYRKQLPRECHHLPQVQRDSDILTRSRSHSQCRPRSHCSQCSSQSHNSQCRSWSHDSQSSPRPYNSQNSPGPYSPQYTSGPHRTTERKPLSHGNQRISSPAENITHSRGQSWKKHSSYTCTSERQKYMHENDEVQQVEGSRSDSSSFSVQQSMRMGTDQYRDVTTDQEVDKARKDGKVHGTLPAVRFQCTKHVTTPIYESDHSKTAQHRILLAQPYSCCCVGQSVRPVTPAVVSGNGQTRDNLCASDSHSAATSSFRAVLRPEIPTARQSHKGQSGHDVTMSRSMENSVSSHDIAHSSRSINRDSRWGGSRVLSLIQHCWAELPEERPSASMVLKRLRSISSGRSLSDNIEQIITRYSEQLEETVHERTQRLEEEKLKYFRVLCEVIPQKYVGDLVCGGKVKAESFSNVTIFFSDIVGFTSICGKCSPQEVLDFLNELYTRFDVVLNSYQVYKVETIGDAYMVAAGIPEAIPNHAEQIALMALHLLSVSVHVKTPHVDEQGNRTRKFLRLRIGLNSGPVVAGIVGEKMPRYCLFGNTVNIASRMESNGKPLRVHMSKETTQELEAIGGFDIIYRGLISVKGKDKPVPTYWLLNSSLHSFELPDWTLWEDSMEH